MNLKARVLSLFLSLLGLSTFAFAAFALADGAAAPAGTAQAIPQPSMAANFVPMIMVAVIIYFLMIRPQQKKVKEQQSMLSSLKHGDQVLTASGILGKVTGITDKVVTLEVADNVRVKMLKSQVSQVVKDQQIKDLA
jgi:preprotein translocase subunit YajC